MIGEEQSTEAPVVQSETPVANPPKKTLGRFGQSLIPLTPVRFNDPLAYTRLGVYGAGIFIGMKLKSKALVYSSVALAAISIASSAAAHTWE